LEIGRFLARNGVTSWLPTLVPDSDDNYARVIAAIDRLMEIQDNEPVARALGVHYEGVFANEKMCGALRPQYFKKFPANQLSELPKLNRGVHVTTYAPEVEGGIGLTRELVRQGWIASIGHTKADVRTLENAFESGARHLTHFYNAMSGLHHREVGVVGWALTQPDVTFDIIADGIHVHPSMLTFACRAKGTENVSLISDSISGAGMGDGEFEIWDEKISVVNGRTQNERGSIAGSVISIHDAVKRMRLSASAMSKSRVWRRKSGEAHRPSG
jgi:N-acetylglucosamine-6-phosphate deacetylase